MQPLADEVIARKADEWRMTEQEFRDSSKFDQWVAGFIAAADAAEELLRALKGRAE